MHLWWTALTFFANAVEDLCKRLETKIELDFPQSGGETLRSQLQSVERQLGIKDPKLKDPGPVPELMSNLWELFWVLNGSRIYTENGPGPITFVELRSYLELCQETLEPWEVNAIRQLDQVYLRVVMDIMAKQQNN